MQNMRSTVLMALALAGALAGCGGSEFDGDREDGFVDHDFGVQRAGLDVGQAGGCDTSIVTGLTGQLFEELVHRLGATLGFG